MSYPAPCTVSRTLESAWAVAIDPASSAVVLEEIMPDLDQVLVMNVNPGFGHQYFFESMLPKIKRVREMIERIELQCGLEVDGGVDARTASLAVEASADILVAGTAIFGQSDCIGAAIERLKAAARL
jgi:ribulose-phosphate 3-epimerase